MHKAYRLILALLETLDEVGSAPSGVLYAGFMSQGMTLSAYDALVRCVTNAPAGKQPCATIDDSHVLSITEAGRAMVRDIRSILADAKAGAA